MPILYARKTLFLGSKENLLSYEDLFKFTKVAIDEGIKKVRITGGEPLLRDGLEHFVKMIADYKEDIDLALTTNGYLLSNYAQKLKDAGLKESMSPWTL